MSRSRHHKTHSRPYICDECHKCFGLRSNLVRHKSLQHNSVRARFHCQWSACKFTALRSDRLKQHIWSSHGKGIHDLDAKHSVPSRLYKESLKEQKHRSQSLSLLAAVSRQDTAQVNLVLRNGADLDARSDKGETALHIAVTNHDTESVRALLKAGIDIDAKDENGCSAFYQAMDMGMADIVQLLLDQRANTLRALDVASLRLPLDILWRKRSMSLLQILLGQLMQKELSDFLSERSIQYPVPPRSDNEKYIETILRVIAGLGTDTCSRVKALYYAARKALSESVNILLQNGIDPASKGNEEMALCNVAREGHTKTLEALLQNCAKSYCPSGATVLHRAANHGNQRAVEVLVQNGADLGAKTSHGDTPLHHAVQSRKNEIVGYLLKHGADPSSADCFDETALHMAAQMGGLDIVKILLINGADPNLKDKWGFTALRLAEIWGHKEIIELLQRHSIKSRIERAR